MLTRVTSCIFVFILQILFIDCENKSSIDHRYLNASFPSEDTQVSIITFHPDEAEHIISVTVRMSCVPDDAIIYYTLDNTKPTINSLSTSSNMPIVIDHAGVTYVRAFGHKAGLIDGPESIKQYLVQERCEDPVITPNGGTFAGQVDVSITSNTFAAIIYYTLDGSTPNENSLRLMNTNVVTIQASCVIHAIAKKIGFADSRVVTSAAFSILPKVATPVISPSSNVFTISASLTITCSTINATIYYTTDGSDPTFSSLIVFPYAPIIVDGEGVHTLKAFAAKNDMLKSDVAVKVFTIQPRAQPPNFSPSPGTFISKVEIHFNCHDSPNGIVYYTQDGHSTPTSSSPHLSCSTSLILNGPGVFKIRAFLAAPGKSPSAIVEAIYNIVRPKYDTFPISKKGKLQLHPQVEIEVVAKNLDETTTTKKQYCSKRNIRGRLLMLKNPVGHFNIIEPAGGCGKGLELPSVSGKSALKKVLEMKSDVYQMRVLDNIHKFYRDKVDSLSYDDYVVWHNAYQGAIESGCEVVTNGGFFNISSTACFGDIVTNGRVVQTSPKHNVNFGIRNGSYVIGYVETPEVLDAENPFETLISGLIWLVRDGKVYVDESVNQQTGDKEDMSVQSTGNYMQFVTIQSARTAIGYDAEGRLLILQVEGESWVRGMSLYEFANFAIELGFVSAINLDGGGSATITVNDTLLSEPSWKCTNQDNGIDDDEPPPVSSSYYENYRYLEYLTSIGIQALDEYRYCEKRVSSITCMHPMPPPQSASLTIAPTKRPSLAPTSTPTDTPTMLPTTSPTSGQTHAPTQFQENPDDDDYIMEPTNPPTTNKIPFSPTHAPTSIVASSANTTMFSEEEYNAVLLNMQMFQYLSGGLAIALLLSICFNIFQCRKLMKSISVDDIGSQIELSKRSSSPNFPLKVDIVNEKGDESEETANLIKLPKQEESLQAKLSRFDYNFADSDGDGDSNHDLESGKEEVVVNLYNKYAPQYDDVENASLLGKHRHKKDKERSKDKEDKYLYKDDYVDSDRIIQQGGSLKKKKKKSANLS